MKMPDRQTLQGRLLKSLTDGSVWDRLNDTLNPKSALYIASSVMLACAIIYLLASMNLHLG
jgi:hypothetical protein